MPTAQDTHPLAPLLFADRPIDGKERDALGVSTFLKFKDREGAIRRLNSAMGRNNESRLRLWAATTLRAWGEPVASDEPMLGLVVEFPVENAIDYVAAYADGSARYLNYSGKAIIWDSPRTVDAVDAAVIAFLNSGMQVLPFTLEAAPWSPTATPRITCLSLMGNRALVPGGDPRGAAPFNTCIQRAVELMTLLIEQPTKR